MTSDEYMASESAKTGKLGGDGNSDEEHVVRQSSVIRKQAAEIERLKLELAEERVKHKLTLDAYDRLTADNVEAAKDNAFLRASKPFQTIVGLTEEIKRLHAEVASRDKLIADMAHAIDMLGGKTHRVE